MLPLLTDGQNMVSAIGEIYAATCRVRGKRSKLWPKYGFDHGQYMVFVTGPPANSRKPDAQTEFARNRPLGVWLFKKWPRNGRATPREIAPIILCC